MKRLIVFAMAGALMLAACSSGGGADELRATAQASGVDVPAQPVQATPPPTPTTAGPLPYHVAATETPNTWPTMPPATSPIGEVLPTATALPIGNTPQPLPTATAEIQGFAGPAVSGIPDTDESAQPCPARYWRAGRCTATAAQIEAYASEVQP